jgi:hypothetical protein
VLDTARFSTPCRVSRFRIEYVHAKLAPETTEMGQEIVVARPIV